LFANHTLKVEWVFPPLDVLLDDARYKDINQDIIFGMGFPRVLITGESERSNTSNSEFAMMPAIKTVDKLRKEIIKIIEDIVFEISEYNNFNSFPSVTFAPLDMHEFKTFIDSLGKLYDSGNLSRESYAKVFGYNWDEEIKRRVEEQKVIEETNIPEFQPQPHSQNPQFGTPGKQSVPNKNQKNT
jgi:hypothetical protein